jgi:nucleoside-diphosphate-sugar epimerase
MRCRRWSTEEGITQVYQLAAMLSATGEAAPLKAWTLNMDGLLNILEVARERGDRQAAESVLAIVDRRLRPEHAGENTPQTTVMDPTTIYGISKLAGERLCEYYFTKYGVDVRSIRYPGIISFKSPPGGGTTDYAIAIFHSALRGERYECFLGPQTTLPMIYMPDAIRATIELMEAPAEQVGPLGSTTWRACRSIRSNWPRRSLAPFPTSRSATSRTAARPSPTPGRKAWTTATATADWGWKARIGVEEMVADMLENVDVHLGKAA